MTQSNSNDNARTAIVILNWNGLSDTKECLSSLRESATKDYHVYLVDNGSVLPEADALEAEFSDVIHRLIRSPVNLGFAEGNNIAIREILDQERYEFVATLNNDMVVEPRWLDRLLAAADANPVAGSIGGKIFLDGTDRVLNSTGIWPLADGAGIDRGRNEADQGQYDSKTDVFGVTAGAALYRANALRQVGLFDSDFFAYNEDVDLAWRLSLHGWRSMYVPDAVAWHKYSQSAGAYSSFKIYHGERNRIWTLWKNFPLWMVMRAWPYTFTKKTMMFLLNIAGRGRGFQYSSRHGLLALTKVLAEAKRDALRGLPKMLQKRRTCRSGMSEDASQILKRYSLPLREVPHR